MQRKGFNNLMGFSCFPQYYGTGTERFQIRIEVADTIAPVMALFRRKFRLTACATTGG
jgi:hypothetical protein